MKRRLFKLASFGLLLVLVAGIGFAVLRGSQVHQSFNSISPGPAGPEGYDEFGGVLNSSTTSTDSGGKAYGITAAEPTASTGMYADVEAGEPYRALAPALSEGVISDDFAGSPSTTRGGTIYKQQYQSPLTAGQVDDNAKYQEYLDYLGTYYGYMNSIDVSQRLFVRVLDGAQMPVAGARVQLFDGIKQVFDGQTVSDGRVLFLPKTADVEQATSLKAVISRGQTSVDATVKMGGPEQVVSLAGVTDNTGAVGIDLVFLLDATGSMGDEIARIKETVGSIAARIEQLPGSGAPRLGLVAFRDQGDDYVTRKWDFTSDVEQFSANLANVEAAGGGDTPEAVNEGLQAVLNMQGWDDNGTGRRLRLIVMVGDAPPHVDYNTSYPALLGEAVAKGIKIFTVGASNLDTDGEYVFRQFAQVTQGQFVFLTYANGVSGEPGVMTDKHVDDFTVQNLDSLIVGLVAGEVANQTGQGVDVGQAQPIPVVESVMTVVPTNWFDALGDLFDGDRGIYLAVLASVVMVVVYGTRREKVRVEVPAQTAEIYVPESYTYPASEIKSGPVTAPLVYFRRAGEPDESDLIAAHIQPSAAEVEVHMDVQPAVGQRTLPLS
jgi:Mg-chelatase subunit ChlD